MFASYEEYRCEDSSGARHGKLWSKEDYQDLLYLLDLSHDAKYIAKALGRSVKAIVLRCVQLGFLDEDPIRGQWRRTDKDPSTCIVSVGNTVVRLHQSNVKPKGESPMNDTTAIPSYATGCMAAPKIEVSLDNFGTVYTIRGKDASLLSDSEIFQVIYSIENQIASLECVQNKPKKLVEMVEALKEDINTLVSYVDGR